MKVSLTLGEVLRRLPQLTKEELGVVRLRVAYLSGTAETPIDGGEPDWLLEAMTIELSRRGLWAQRHVPRKMLPTDFDTQAAAVRKHLLQGYGKSAVRMSEGLTVGGFAATTLADYLVRTGVPLTPKTFFYSVHKIPTALEASFPGYWTNGKLAFCVARQ